MNAFLKSMALRVPAVRNLLAERNALRQQIEALQVQALQHHSEQSRRTAAANGVVVQREAEDWSPNKARKRQESETWRAQAHERRLTPFFPPIEGHLAATTEDAVRRSVSAEPYWFQKIEVLPGFYSPGWSDPAKEKLPHYGLPDDLTGMRVLDIGCAEGFFSFEAERRGAREVIGIDSFPDSVRRFNIVKQARQSNANAYLMNVYDLDPKRLGTFDLVLFYGVFYHLKHPQYALERIRSVCVGDLLFQTHMLEDPAVKGEPWARFYPHGMMSGAQKENFDPTVFWLFNSTCCVAMLDHLGFEDVRILSTDPQPFVIKARAPQQGRGAPPDQSDSPWC